MSRLYDVIIFGASGFTAGYIIEELIRYTAKSKQNLKWALAGRNVSKIKDTLNTANDYAKTDFNPNNVKIIEADITNTDSLNNMAKLCHVLVNCVGPYNTLGEAVVKSCLEQSTNYLDISGEPLFVERIQQTYNKMAKEKNVYIITSSGFDSIPCDMGVEFMRSNFAGTLDSIEIYISADAPAGLEANQTTWDCILAGYSHVNELREVRNNLYNDMFPEVKKFKSKWWPHRRSIAYYEMGKFLLPYPGSDRSIVKRSQMHIYNLYKERPIHVEPYVVVPELLSLFCMAFFGGIFFLLLPFRFGRWMLQKYPAFFTNGLIRYRPKRKKIDATTFKMVFKAKGWKEKLSSPLEKPQNPPDTVLMGAITGGHPGYNATAQCLVQALVTLLEEREKLPDTGGVFTTAPAFVKTSLIKRLNENGIEFRMIE